MAMGCGGQGIVTLRGIDRVSAATLVAELGDLRRFAHARELMAFVGLVPSEHSSGDSRRNGAITRTGNGYARRSWWRLPGATASRPASVGRSKFARKASRRRYARLPGRPRYFEPALPGAHPGRLCTTRSAWRWPGN